MLVRGGQVVGVLNVHAKQPRSYGDRDLFLLTQVADLLARAVENAQLYQRLTEREETLERFAARTLEAQELERRRLAGEIHDGISQRLISLWYHLVAAEDELGSEGMVGTQLAAAKDLVTTTLEEARRAITNLRPSILDDLGLGPSLESLARTMLGPEVELDVTTCRLAPHVEVALYRIAQEALQNVVKHAQAATVAVRLSVDPDGVRLIVQDDGVGFSADARKRGAGSSTASSYGLVGMRERAELISAKLTVVSREGDGTTVEVLVP
jgi:signal transduction histidine kinase